MRILITSILIIVLLTSFISNDKCSELRHVPSANLAGQYICDEVIEPNSNGFSITGNAKECPISKKVYVQYYKGKETGESVIYPLIIETNGNEITMISRSENTKYGSIQLEIPRTTTEAVMRATGTMEANEFVLNGKCVWKYLSNPKNYKDPNTDNTLVAYITVLQNDMLEIKTVFTLKVNSPYKVTTQKLKYKKII